MQPSSTQLEVTYLRTSSLKPDPKNPRVHSDKQVRQIAQSIESFGFNVPLLIDDKQMVIAGHGRLQAARKLGWDTVPAIRLSHLTETQRMAFLIADNRLTENSTWDERMLGEQLKILSELELDFDLEVIGFEVSEIDIFIDGLTNVPTPILMIAYQIPRRRRSLLEVIYGSWASIASFVVTRWSQLTPAASWMVRRQIL
jgi:ParB-like chromosome segregation protein Spo0J